MTRLPPRALSLVARAVMTTLRDKTLLTKAMVIPMPVLPRAKARAVMVERTIPNPQDKTPLTKERAVLMPLPPRKLPRRARLVVPPRSNH